MFSFFRKKYSCRVLFPEGMDTHSHLLPGVDDGAQRTEDTQVLVSAMQARGLHGCICTPHISLRFPANTEESLRCVFEECRRRIAGSHPDFTLKLSAEYMLDERFPHLLEKGNLLSWGSPELLLVELSAVHPIRGWADILTSIIRKGYHPVLAHPERYHRHLDMNDLQHLHRMGIRFQGNIGALSGKYGHTVRKRCLRLQTAGLYSYWGSDAHSAADFRELPLRF